MVDWFVDWLVALSGCRVYGSVGIDDKCITYYAIDLTCLSDCLFCVGGTANSRCFELKTRYVVFVVGFVLSYDTESVSLNKRCCRSVQRG